MNYTTMEDVEIMTYLGALDFNDTLLWSMGSNHGRPSPLANPLHCPMSCWSIDRSVGSGNS